MVGLNSLKFYDLKWFYDSKLQGILYSGQSGLVFRSVHGDARESEI